MDTLDTFLTHFQRQRGWTDQLIQAIPEENFNWRPSEESFSLGGLVRHMIQAEAFFTRLLVHAAEGKAYDPFAAVPGTPGVERMEAFRAPNVQGSLDERYGTSFATCLASWDRVRARTAEQLSGFGEEDLEKRVTHPLTGIETSIWEMLLIMLSHESHHRGQLSAFMKVLGLEQPAVMATS